MTINEREFHAKQFQPCADLAREVYAGGQVRPPLPNTKVLVAKKDGRVVASCLIAEGMELLLFRFTREYKEQGCILVSGPLIKIMP